MSDSKNDEAKFNETLKRMLDTKPTPHKTGTGPKPDAHGSGHKESDDKRNSPKASG